MIERSGLGGEIYLVCEAEGPAHRRARVIAFPEPDRAICPPKGQRAELLLCDLGHPMRQITREEAEARREEGLATLQQAASAVRAAAAAEVVAALVAKGIDETQAQSFAASLSIGELVGLLLRP